MQRKLTARIESIDESTGIFPMTLATEGEASDGHILSIKGAQIPERMPLLVSHFNDPSSQAGSITGGRKHMKESPARLTAMGQIELGGSGPLAEIRRDLAHMIGKGHVGAVSVRWDDVSGKTIRRVNLAPDHPHFVDSSRETDERKLFGCYFSEWRALEGSVVAIGADPKALIGRSDETQGEVRSFWRAMAQDAEHTGEADVAAALAALRLDARECIELGASTADLFNSVCDPDDAAFEPVEFSGRRFFLPAAAAKAVAEERAASLDHATPDPVPDTAPEKPVDPPARRVEVLDPAAIARLGTLLDASDEKWARTVEALIDKARGRVTA